MWHRLLDYTEVLAGPVVRREPAGAGVPLILNFSGEVGIDGAIFNAGFIAGPTDRYTDTVNRGYARGVQADLSWSVARQVVGRPLGEFAGQTVAVEDLWGAAGRRLIHQLAEAPAAPERLALVAGFLHSRMTDNRFPVPATAEQALRLLAGHRGGLGVAGVAEALDCGRQHLHRLLTHQFGVAPRAAVRLLRFQDVLDAVRRGAVTPGGWAALAAEHGYYDQAHLCRDFRSIAGLTPGAILANFGPRRQTSNRLTACAATVGP